MKTPPALTQFEENNSESSTKIFKYSNKYAHNNTPKSLKQQVVSLNGDAISCNSIESDEALTCDVTFTPQKPKSKSVCVNIRENKWYDAASSITSLSHVLENMSLGYNSSTKQLFSLDEAQNSSDQVSPNSYKTKIFFNDNFQYEDCESSGDTTPKTFSLPRSYSSTVSSLSEFSPSNSSLGSSEECPSEGKFTNFLKSVFSWKTSKEKSYLNSPLRNSEKVGGTLALIQQCRPANLPAKNALEEENHRKQHEAILEAARKREQREERERRLQREMQLKEEEKLAEDIQVWTTQVIPQFETLKNTKKVHDLWWKGLPPCVRGKVWKLAIKNELNITLQLFRLSLERGKSKQNNDSLNAIKLDVSRTFPSLCVFQSGGPLSDSLQSILAAYTVYRPDMGYVQGMSFIGAILSLNMDVAEAFTCFANLLNRPCHRAAFSLNQYQMGLYYKIYSNALAEKLPKIYSHFVSSGLSPDLYLLDWLYTIFSKALPLDVTCRIWDVFLRDGDEFLFRTALGILHLYQDELLEMDFVTGAQFLTRLPENIQSDALFNSISQMSTVVGTMTFDQMLAQYLSTNS